MRRLLVIVALVAVVGAVVVTSAAMGGGASSPTSFTIELDNAFGLVQGGDFKVAGVRAGSISSISLDQRSLHALIGVKVSETGFGSFRTDATCSSRPQSLIGEYFLDCQPGHAPTLLSAGGHIPVTQTTTTVAPDLVNDILRRPYDQRLSLIIDELGAAVAGRGGDLGAALHRAVPALTQLDGVLSKLANQNATLKDLTQNGDLVIRGLAQGQGDLTHFVDSSARLSTLTAQRAASLQATLQRLPAFFAELGPTMRQLGQAADANTPALADIDSNAALLRRFFNDLGPVAQAGRPAVSTLAAAADQGRRTIPILQPRINELTTLSQSTPELAQNLRIILDHLNDRSFAVEPNPQSPGGKGYTGLEGIPNYVFDQALSTNIHDATHNILKVDLFLEPDCSPYADAAKVNGSTPAVQAKCNAFLGPTQPNLLGQPDVNDRATASAASRAGGPRVASSSTRALTPASSAPRVGGPAAPAASAAPGAPAAPAAGGPVGTVGQTLQQTLQQVLRNTPPVSVPGASSAPASSGGHGSSDPSTALLGYLTGP